MDRNRKNLHLKLRKKYKYRTKNNWKGNYLILTRADNSKNSDIEFVIDSKNCDQISIYVNQRGENYSISGCKMSIDELDTVYNAIKKAIEEVKEKI